MATTLPAGPPLAAWLVLDGLLDVVVGVLDAAPLVGSVLLERALLVVIVGVDDSLLVPDCVLVTAVVFGAVVTGVSGMRVPATDELDAEVVAALEPTGFSLGTVTCGLAALGGNWLRLALADAVTGEGEVADRPTALPQAASSRTVMP